MSLVTLASDFGTRDGYVAQMKGVLLSEGASDLRLCDLSHDLSPQDVVGAALFAQSVYPRFPSAIHVMVVDPGVGSERRGLCARAGDTLLVGPDNGVFSLWLGELATPAEVHEIDLARLPAPISNTFHGRDVFARVAAALSRGETLASIGPHLAHPVALHLPEPSVDTHTLRGEVIHVDRFGNLISNIGRAALQAWAQADALEVRCNGRMLGAPRAYYAEVPVGQLLVLFDSSDRLEIAVRDGSASSELGAAFGTPIAIERRRA